MFLLTLAIAFSYFIVIYLNPPKDLPSDRNDLRVIKFRFTRITQLCLLLLIAAPYVVQGNYFDNIRTLGLFPGFTNTHNIVTDLKSIFQAIIVILTIYSSSIYQYFIGDVEFIDQEAHILHHIRDYLFAPITEEFIYRGIINLVVQDTHAKYTPYLFGIAHLHHAFHLYNLGYPIDQVLITSIFQLLYTSIFGVLANLIYLATSNNLVCVVVIHAGCNVFGIPQLIINGTKLQRFLYSMLVLGSIIGTYIEITWWYW